MAPQALLQEIQRASGLSQAELARRAGIPRSVLNVYLHGHREPGADALRRIAAAGGFSLGLTPRRPPVDEERASRILMQVLELAEALPYRPRAEPDHPSLREQLAARGATV
ncbi:MAG TPA: helix-turn-helix transcriptional regulator [Solirubrobacterales bacterium]|nr:helix-turn-helix transcriptional regulator [Solirubrobacterales bacterium]